MPKCVLWVFQWSSFVVSSDVATYSGILHPRSWPRGVAPATGERCAGKEHQGERVYQGRPPRGPERARSAR